MTAITRQVTRQSSGDGPRATPRSLIDGAIAGAVATWVMGFATAYMYEREDKEVRRREDDARGGKTAYGVAAEKLADAAGVSLSDDERKKAGSAIHWTLGTAGGAAYGIIKGDNPSIEPLRALGFGTAFWGVMDEAVPPAFGLTPGPNAFPLETHARGLVGHLVFAVTVDAVLSLLNRTA